MINRITVLLSQEYKICCEVVLSPRRHVSAPRRSGSAEFYELTISDHCIHPEVLNKCHHPCAPVFLLTSEAAGRISESVLTSSAAVVSLVASRSADMLGHNR